MNTVQFFFICNSSNGITEPAIFALYIFVSGSHRARGSCHQNAGCYSESLRRFQRRGLRRGQTKRRMVQHDRRWRQKFQLFFFSFIVFGEVRNRNVIPQVRRVRKEREAAVASQQFNNQIRIPSFQSISTIKLMYSGHKRLTRTVSEIFVDKKRNQVTSVKKELKPSCHAKIDYTTDHSLNFLECNARPYMAIVFDAQDMNNIDNDIQDLQRNYL